MGDSDDYGNVSRNLRGCLGFALTCTVVLAGLLTCTVVLAGLLTLLI